jgi:hypothetical protein
MAGPDELLAWLNAKTESNLDSIEDDRLSRTICFYLVNLTGQAELAAKIKTGKKQVDKSSNYQLAKSLLGCLDCAFPCKIVNLVEGSREAIVSLLQTLVDLDRAGNDDDDDNGEFSLDNLLDALQEDLVGKLRDARDFRDQMDALARERDFYFDKLHRIALAANAYPPETVGAIKKLISSAPNDFLPVE